MMDSLNNLFHLQVLSNNYSEGGAVNYATLTWILIGDLQNVSHLSPNTLGVVSVLYNR
jgi:hypothetical protein